MNIKKVSTEKAGFNFGVFSVKEEKETIEVRLARLVATYKVKYVPLTARQRELAQEKVSPYEGMSPDRAMIEYNTLIKSLPSAEAVTGYFPKVNRVKPISMRISSVVVDGGEVIPIGGSLEALSGLEIFAREAANILVVYTSHDGQYVTDKVTADGALGVRMPVLSLSNLRKLVNVPGGDNCETRDAIYQRLKDKTAAARCVLLYIIHTIYAHTDLKPIRIVNSDLTKYYAANKSGDMPVILELYVPSPTTFTSIYLTQSVPCWKFACRSLAARGGKKHRGAISMGYYRYDMPSADVDLCDEMTDVYNLCIQYKYTAVKLISPAIPLARYLISNGITVYCPALRNTVQGPKDPVDIYARGYMKFMIWEAKTQNMPTLSTNTIAMPEPGVMAQGQSYVYEYIPEHVEPQALYLPSIKVADGLCIKTFVKGVSGVSLEALRERFSMAVYYRNWYIFTRLSFVSQDKMRDRFLVPWVCPPLVDAKADDIFATAREFCVSNEREASAMSIIYSEIPAIPILERPDANRKWDEELKSVLETLELDRIKHTLMYQTEANAVPGTEECFTNMSQSDYFQIVNDYVTYVEGLSEPVLPAVVRQNEMDPSLSLEPAVVDDIFNTATSRTVFKSTAETPPPS